MNLRLYNTLTRRKEDFVPLDPSNVRMYVCGPTVYDFAHIGNARPVIVFDVLYRLLRHLYGAAHVTYARNITDVDDKIIVRAAEEGVAIDALTERTSAQFHEDVKALGCLPPTVEPRATEHIPQMIAMIERLIALGHAYEAEGHVLFHVPSMPDYGRLANKSLDDMIEGARVEVAPYKHDPLDFVLWKPAKSGEPGWDSPWGHGRPGWHIECSAMSAAHLGEVFDIHGGGIDLVFPHHENEIAQSRCAHGTDTMARFWLHNGFLQVEGEKMAKSLGNFVTIRELLDGWRGYRWPGAAVRLNMLRSHYRRPMDWTFSSLDEAHKVLSGWAHELDGVDAAEAVPEGVVAALCDDLNTSQAITQLHRLAKSKDLPALKAGLDMLGVASWREAILRVPVDIQAERAGVGDRAAEANGEPLATALSKAEIEERIAARAAARKGRDFAQADRIRDELAEARIVLKDHPDGTTTWEVAR